MRKSFTRIVVLILTIIMCFSVLGGCKNDNGNIPEPPAENEEKAKRPTVDGQIYGTGRTLNIYVPGTKPKELDSVIAEYKKRTKDIFGFDVQFRFDPLDAYKQNLTLQIGSGSGGDLDLVFDAQWIYLQEWSKAGNYKKLDKFFENSEYPGLNKAFSSDYLKNNKWNKGIYGIPLMESFGSTNAAFYREDWRKEAVAAGETRLADGINTSEQAEIYLYWVKNNKTGVTPILANKDGFGPYNVAAGFYDKGDKPTIAQSNKMGVRNGWNIYGNTLVSAYVNPETKEVEGVYIPQYEDAQAALDFPQQFATEQAHMGDWVSSYNKVRKWYTDGIISSDAINENDSESLFRVGAGGMIVRSLEQFVSIKSELLVNEPTAELEIFMYSQAERELTQPNWGTDFKAWNYLAVPSTSPDEDLAMLFMDWLFATRENHDLFQYGIEGTHWTKIDPTNANEDYQVSVTSAHKPYTLPGYYLTWNPTYLRSPAGVSPKVSKYLKYVHDPKTYTTFLYPDFRFDYTPVLTELQNPLWGTYQTQNIPYLLGTQNDPVGQFTTLITARLNNKKFQENLLIIKEEFRAQLQAYIDEQ